jgi:hypothetical protein
LTRAFAPGAKKRAMQNSSNSTARIPWKAIKKMSVIVSYKVPGNKLLMFSVIE